MARNRFRASYSRTGCYFQKKKNKRLSEVISFDFPCYFSTNQEKRDYSRNDLFFFFYCNPVKKKS